MVFVVLLYEQILMYGGEGPKDRYSCRQGTKVYMLLCPRFYSKLSIKLREHEKGHFDGVLMH